MANGNDMRQYSIIIGIVGTLILSGAGYGKLQSQASENTKTSLENRGDVRELAKKLDDKLDAQNEKITRILIAVEQIKAKVN